MQKKEFKLLPNPGIMSAPVYIGGEQPNLLDKKIIKLNSNENPFGPSKLAMEALRNSFDLINNYPSSSHEKLRKAISNIYNIDFENITCGAGSDELISFICQCFCSPNDEVVYTEHGFAMYRISASLRGAIPIKAKETNRFADVDNILKKCNNKTKIVFLANPNNPTGTYLTKIELLELRKKLRQNILLVIDDAYYEYMVNKDYKSGLELFKNKKNVFVLRTFSKIYGLASLRIGWGYGSKDIVKELLKIKPPFNINKIAEMAAVEALKDKSFISKSVKHNLKWAYKIKKALENYKIETNKVSANFLLLDFDNCKYSAIKIKKSLEKKGILLRSLEAYKIKNKLRLTIGNTRENILLLKTLEKIFRK